MTAAPSPEEDDLCVGVCMADPETGYCLGCGRPLFPEPASSVHDEVDPPQEAGVKPPGTSTA